MVCHIQVAIDAYFMSLIVYSANTSDRIGSLVSVEYVPETCSLLPLNVPVNLPACIECYLSQCFIHFTVTRHIPSPIQNRCSHS